MSTGSVVVVPGPAGAAGEQQRAQGRDKKPKHMEELETFLLEMGAPRAGAQLRSEVVCISNRAVAELPPAAGLLTLRLAAAFLLAEAVLASVARVRLRRFAGCAPFARTFLL